MNEQFISLPLINNTRENRFEMVVDGATSIIEYRQLPGALALLHTEVPQILEGKGVAAAIVEKTFNYAKENNVKIIPLCPYVLVYLKKHPEWNILIHEDYKK
ncbi:N-acetyltransferase [Terrimonas sp.]|uniref:GNAT family N-acetyltransferase n=1 Tax=Terrimonas sp. TaxID=1914338 RepID=UPI000D51E35C|nr:GNAT family N-acetyltransferase [Terrimonas sp.]PVD53891.1 N-acetyltransferase [Terrimonas sp.]